jgi:hypothetical protein
MYQRRENIRKKYRPWSYKEVLLKLVKWIDTWPEDKMQNTGTIRKYFKLPTKTVDFWAAARNDKIEDQRIKQQTLATACSVLASLDILGKVEGTAYVDGRVHWYVRGKRRLIARKDK